MTERWDGGIGSECRIWGEKGRKNGKRLGRKQLAEKTVGGGSLDPELEVMEPSQGSGKRIRDLSGRRVSCRRQHQKGGGAEECPPARAVLKRNIFGVGL